MGVTHQRNPLVIGGLIDWVIDCKAFYAIGNISDLEQQVMGGKFRSNIRLFACDGDYLVKLKKKLLSGEKSNLYVLPDLHKSVKNFIVYFRYNANHAKKQISL